MKLFTIIMVSCEEVKEKIESYIPNSTAEVTNPRGDNVHFSVEVESSEFAGKSLIEQHKMVYQAFNNELAECGLPLHALQIKTKTGK